MSNIQVIWKKGSNRGKEGNVIDKREETKNKEAGKDTPHNVRQTIIQRICKFLKKQIFHTPCTHLFVYIGLLPIHSYKSKTYAHLNHITLYYTVFTTKMSKLRDNRSLLFQVSISFLYENRSSKSASTDVSH